jgi:predicted transcriptional regulator
MSETPGLMIEEGLRQSEAGEVISHDEVKRRFLA